MKNDNDKDLRSASESAASDSWQREFRLQQVAILVRQAPLLALANLVNAALVASVLWNHAPHWSLAVWLVAIVLIAVYPLRAWWLSRRQPPRGSGSQRSVRRAIMQGGIAGLVWASAVPFFIWGLDDEIVLFLAVVLSGMAAGGAVVLSSIPRAAVAYSLPVFAAVVAVIVGTGDVMLATLAVMLVFFFFTVTLASRSVFLGATNALRDKYLETEEKALHQGRFADFVAAASDWFWEMDRERRYTFVSSAIAGKVGRDPEWYLGKTLDEIIERFYNRAEWEPFFQAFEARQPIRDLVVRRSEDGEVRWIRNSAIPVFDADGAFTGFRGVTADISQEMLAEATLRESEQRYRDLVESAVQGIFIIDQRSGPLFVNQAAADMFGYASPEQVLALGSLEPLTAPHEVERLRQIREGRLRGEAAPPLFEFEGRRKDGSVIWLLNHARMIEWKGEPAVQVTVVDITDRKRAEEALRQSESRLSGVLGLAPDAIIAVDEDQVIRLFNQGAETIFGYGAEAAIGRSLDILLPPRFRDLHRRHIEDFAAAAEASRRMDSRSEIVGLRRDGSEFPAEASISKLQMGESKLLTVILRDITDRKLREEILLRAQRMEAVGQLTGGIAHDFNNLLAIIQGNISFLDRKLDDDELKALTEPALRAAKRGASLTQRLLAFSRRQPLVVEVVDAGALVTDLVDLLRRSLGEDVAVEIAVEPALWACEVDIGQLEQAIVNLANNSRDAMADGGKLTLAVANAQVSETQAAQRSEATAGDYVMIAVTDTGGGMTAAVREKIFEPFFTTKEIGKGTGLGLSMIYGFVQQSGGHVTAYSEPGLGTTVKLYLPRSHAIAGADQETVSEPIETANIESILVVEDDGDLRTLAVVVLSDLGYRVLEAGSAAQALQLVEHDSRIDLLLADVVLPGGIGGQALADALQARIPALKVLYMSGYPEGAMVHDGRLGPEIPLLQKPFDPAELARAVRAAIDA